MTKITGGPRPPNISEPSVAGPSAPAASVPAQPLIPGAAPKDGFETSIESRGAPAPDGGPVHTSEVLHALLDDIKAKDLGDAPAIAPAPAYALSLPSVSKVHAFALPLPAEDLVALKGLKPELAAVQDPSLRRALSDVCDLAEVS